MSIFDVVVVVDIIEETKLIDVDKSNFKNILVIILFRSVFGFSSEN